MSEKKSFEKNNTREQEADSGEERDLQHRSGIQDDDSSISAEKNKSVDEESDIAELIREAPPQVKTMMLGMMRTSVARSGHHPLFDKFTSEHIDKFLDYSHQDDENSFKYTSSNRWFHLAYAILGLAFFVFLVVYLLPSNQPLFLIY